MKRQTQISARALLAGAVGLAALWTAPVAAHPHVFVDAAADLHVTPDDELSALRIFWTADTFTSLYFLSTLGIDPDGDRPFTDAEKRTILEDSTLFPPNFELDSYMSLDGARVTLSGHRNADVKLEDDRLVVSFDRHLETPVRLGGAQIEIEIYDPSYFIDYDVARAPRGLPDDGSCSAEVIPFEPGSETAALQDRLAALGREETPEIENVGALFTDRIVIRCD